MLKLLLVIVGLVVVFFLGALWELSRSPRPIVSPPPPPVETPMAVVTPEETPFRVEPVGTPLSPEAPEQVPAEETPRARASALTSEDLSHIGELTRLAEALLQSGDTARPEPPPIPDDLRQKLHELSPELLNLVELMIRFSPEERPVKREQSGN